MRLTALRISLPALLALAMPPPAGAATVSVRDAPKADARLLQALNSGAQELQVLVGLAGSAAPPVEGEGQARMAIRRADRLSAGTRLEREISPEDFQAVRSFQSFPIVAGRASREGALRLANRSDVSWVTVDGTMKLMQASAPQAMQVLIRSDRTNALGFTGKNQTIAVLDTGVDYRLPEMGGGRFPNAKVVGGTDTADGDADPLDCEGHGTSVASIAANLVAPDARIVAVKVFPGCAGFTPFSAILAGIDFSIVNRSRFGITAINMSLGGFAGRDNSDLGYCDALFPEFATAIDAATTAGIVVLVASGNEGLANSLSVPACISSAVSVGAVYSSELLSFDWGEFCSDRLISPDLPTCFSNATSNLDLLAPGAFWSVPTAGGKVISFSGTSAAAPAAAGAVALLREARPNLPVSAIVGILKLSGQPVTTEASGTITPRVDTLAAVQLSSASFASFSGNAVPIPDGSGSAQATVTTSGFTAALASVQTWVQIDHPDPSQLRLRLAGPDGTSVLLHDQSGRLEHPINTVFGRTEGAAFSLSAFQGKQANGVWTLTVEDRVSGSAGRIRNFSIVLVPGQPPEAIPAFPEAVVVPFLSRSDSTRLATSDLRVYNPTAAAKTLRLYFVPSLLGGAQAVKATRTVEAGQVLVLDDVIFSEFGYASASGHLTILSNDSKIFATNRFSTRGPAGSLGFLVPGLPASTGIAAGSGAASMNGLSRSYVFTSGVGFTEVSGAPVDVRFDIRDGNGSLLGTMTQLGDAHQSASVGDLIRFLGLPINSNFRVDLAVTSPAGRILPFAAARDDVTGDNFILPGASPALSPGDIILPHAARAPETSADILKTDLFISNAGSSPATVTVSLIPRILGGTPNAPRVYTLAPGETLAKFDVLKSEFNLESPSVAALRIRPSAAARLAVSARSSVEKAGGTFGFSQAGVPAASALGMGDGTATAIHLDQTTGASGLRSQFGLVEVSGASAIVRATIKSGDTGATLGTQTYPLAANSLFQLSLTDILGTASARNIYVQFRVESGAGRFLAFGLSADPSSGDASFVQAQKEP